jgi:hypothetical protein
MATEFPLFDQLDRMQREAHAAVTLRPPPQKRVQPTSSMALQQILETLPFRERAVFTALRRFIANHRLLPTAYELFEEMKARGEAFDLNSVRPRLTELRDRRLVQTAGKKKCAVSGKAALTWRTLLEGKPDAN